MTRGFKDKDKKFHPITQSKGVRKKKDKTVSVSGIKTSIGIRNKRSVSVGGMVHDSEDRFFRNWFKETLRQNHGYEQMMQELHERILEGQKDGKDVSFEKQWLRKVVDAERERPDKSFYYHWVTREVEDIIEENPNLRFDDIKLRIDSLDADATDKQIRDGIKILLDDKKIEWTGSGYVIDEDGQP